MLCGPLQASREGDLVESLATKNRELRQVTKDLDASRAERAKDKVCTRYRRHGER